MKHLLTCICFALGLAATARAAPSDVIPPRAPEVPPPAVFLQDFPGAPCLPVGFVVRQFERVHGERLVFLGDGPALVRGGVSRFFVLWNPNTGTWTSGYFVEDLACLTGVGQRGFIAPPKGIKPDRPA